MAQELPATPAGARPCFSLFIPRLVAWLHSFNSPIHPPFSSSLFPSPGGTLTTRLYISPSNRFLRTGFWETGESPIRSTSSRRPSLASPADRHHSSLPKAFSWTGPPRTTPTLPQRQVYRYWQRGDLESPHHSYARIAPIATESRSPTAATGHLQRRRRRSIRLVLIRHAAITEDRGPGDRPPCSSLR